MLDHRTARILQDLLQAAWQLTDERFEQLLEVSPGWLDAFRIHEVELAPKILKRLSRLAGFHDALRLWFPQELYGEAWRVTWKESSPIGSSTLLQAWDQDGDQALDKVEQFFRYQGP